MLRNKLVRSDGSIIDSSVIISCEFTEEVNSNTNLSVGDVTASELTVEMLSTDIVQQDEVLTYSIIEDGVETLIGIFNVEKPTVATRTSMKFSAYDNIAKTEKVFSVWLRENQSQFPMTLLTLVQQACSLCGVGLATTDFPHSDLQIKAFYADGLTCRQILSWAAAIAGRFVRANAEGNLEFAWYSNAISTRLAPFRGSSDAKVSVTDDGDGNITIESNNLTIEDDGEGNVSLFADGLKVVTEEAGIVLSGSDGTTIPFMRDKMSYESYYTDLIVQVLIKHADDDVGVTYPVNATGNCFTISGNMLLGTLATEDIAQVAQSIYEQLHNITYVPFSATVPRTILVRAGERLEVSDSNGNVFWSYVMNVAVSPTGTVLSATGDKSYGSRAAVSSEKYNNLTGKILKLSQSIDGLAVRNEDLLGRVGGLELSTESFKTYVEYSFVAEDSFEKYKTEAEQTVQDFIQRFESLDQYRNETSANIKNGILYYNEDNVPVYGMEIGQKTERDGQEIFDRYARFTSEKLSFFDQNGDEVTQIGDKKMSVTNVEITGSHDGGSQEYGTFKHGSFIDIALEDGTIVSKWVGGS